MAMIIQAMNTPNAMPHSQTISHTIRLSGVASLQGSLGIIRASGTDAASFLQGQLTQDVLQIKPDEARLAAFCSAKGRMQASFTIFLNAEGDFLLLCSADLLAATLKRLSMFVMRAKVKLSDASADYVLCGLTGTAASAWLESPNDATKMIAARARIHWPKATFDAQNGVILPSVEEIQRVLWCAPMGTALPAGQALGIDTWRWLEVQAGIAMVTQPIADQFVPQMLNYESVGGVSFKKGCYPGQEIVARSQFRGTIKRRTYLAHQPLTQRIAPFIGQAVFYSLDSSQPCGTVLTLAPSQAPITGFNLLVCLQTSAAEAATEGKGFLFITQTSAAESTEAAAVPSNRDVALELMDLPYRLLEDI